MKRKINNFLLIIILLIGLIFLSFSCGDTGMQDLEKTSPVSISGVILRKNSTEIFIGSTEQLIALLEPSDAADQSVSWTTDDESIAAVDSSGIVTGIAEGTATITVTTTDGGYTDTCEVTVQKIWTASQSGSAETAGSSVTYTNNQDNFSFTLKACPGGTFPTGVDDNGDISGFDTLSVDSPAAVTSFWIGETEVTYELWYSIRDWAENTASPSYTFRFSGREGDDGTAGASPSDDGQEPVTVITWRDVMIWCNALTEYYNASKDFELNCVYYTDDGYTAPIRAVDNSETVSWEEGPGPNDGSQDDPYIKADANGFRLLTSNEWELAARWRDDDGNTVEGYTSPWFTTGNSASGATTWYKDAVDESGDPAKSANDLVAVYQDYWDGSDWAWTGVNNTAEVKTKKANTLGLYDMSGNVQEWCFDWYPGDEGSYRVRRGGGKDSSATYLQVGFPYRGNPYGAGSEIGFRVSRSPD